MNSYIDLKIQIYVEILFDVDNIDLIHSISICQFEIVKLDN
jgi:hypothetical protein